MTYSSHINSIITMMWQERTWSSSMDAQPSEPWTNS